MGASRPHGLGAAPSTTRPPKLVVFGRAVANVLQNLPSTVGVEAFNEWYEPIQTQMREDLLLRFFYRLRSEILKQGTLHTSTSIYISHLNTSDLQPLM